MYRKDPFRPADNSPFSRYLTHMSLLCSREHYTRACSLAMLDGIICGKKNADFAGVFVMKVHIVGLFFTI